jgi:hypothetical protein
MLLCDARHRPSPLRTHGLVRPARPDLFAAVLRAGKDVPDPSGILDSGAVTDPLR